MVVRVSYYQGEDYGGCIDLPDSCSVRTAVRSMIGRGWIEVLPLDNDNDNDRIRMEKGDTHAYIEVIEIQKELSESA